MNFKSWFRSRFPKAKRGSSTDEFFIKCLNSECEDNTKSPKFKLGVNTSTGKYHCFRCGISGASKISFLKLAGEKNYKLSSAPVDSFVKNIRDKFSKAEIKKVTVTLPDHCVPVEDSPLAQAYLSRRGINLHEVARYKLKFCLKGEYGFRIIFPIYENEDLVFFQARTIIGGIPKVLNPKVDKSGFIFNLSNLSKEKDSVVITEGLFDAITIGGNTIALLGKTITKKQIETIKGLKQITKIYVMLDGDAQIEAIALCHTLCSLGFETFHVKLNDGEDPNMLGRVTSLKRIAEAKKYSFNNLIRSILEGKK